MKDLDTMTAEFVGRLSVAVWIGRLTDDAACEVLEAYAAACQRMDPSPVPDKSRSILAEYRYRREAQDLCS